MIERTRDHPDMNHFFVEYPGDTTWMEVNLFDGDMTVYNQKIRLSPVVSPSNELTSICVQSLGNPTKKRLIKDRLFVIHLHSL